jgi:DNA topoisomerase III
MPVPVCANAHAWWGAQTSADIKANLQAEARYSSDVLIWTDCDREGENIGMEVIGVCREANPRIRAHRAVFASMNPAYARST